MPRRFFLLLTLLAAGLAWACKRPTLPRASSRTHTIESRLAEFGPAVEKRLKPDFERAGVAYPPHRMVLVGLKAEKKLEMYAANEYGPLSLIKTYPVQAASGVSGPKLREGDRQVPEGIYGIEYLNPNSLYHLSMKVSYPNEFDRARAAEEGRTGLGGDIMIHGRAVSIGCLAMGDPAAEELFVLGALVGVGNIAVLIAPVDFRTTDRLPGDGAKLPEWTGELYRHLREVLDELR